MADPTTTPTVEDVQAFLGAHPGGPISLDVLTEALGAARERVLARCMDFPVVGDPPAPEAPDVVIQAITMLAARLYRRRFSTGGFEGFGDLGVVRVPVLDPDIEDLLVRHIRYDFA